MATSTEIQDFEFKAKTDIWTGNANRKESDLVTSGLLGSIRWWFEVLVRGLEGAACDPNNTKCQEKDHCVVCELFGCTGWARKFRFQVCDENDNVIQKQIIEGMTFKLRFIPLRPIKEEEWALLEATLRLISEYGAIGGKTVFKPSDEDNCKSKKHHRDYGIAQLKNNQLLFIKRIHLAQIKIYCTPEKWKKVQHCIITKSNGKEQKEDFEWASLENFWYVNGRYLCRKNWNESSFNRILGRPEPKKASTNNDSWLAGSQQISKKVFSFRNPPRTFGFVNPKLIDFDAMKQRLSQVWQQDGWNFIEGETIKDRLFTEKDGHS